MDIFEALEAAGFVRAGSLSQDGKVLEYDYFNDEQVHVRVSYAYTHNKPDAP